MAERKKSKRAGRAQKKVSVHWRPSQEEAISAITKGASLLKFGRRGKPHPVYLRLENRDCLTWVGEKFKRPARRVRLAWVEGILEGQATPVFQRQPRPELEGRSFSVLYKDGEGRPRSLDLACQDAAQFHLWLLGLNNLLEALQSPKGKKPPPVPEGAGEEITETLDGFPRLVEPAELPRSDSGSSAVKDIYAWGSPGNRYPPGEIASLEQQDPLWLHSKEPEILEGTESLNVQVAAVGCRHGLLVTREGVMYSWGDGRHGRLGNGLLLAGASGPQRLDVLDSRTVAQFQCGLYHNVAVTQDGSAFTWGDDKFRTGILGVAGDPMQSIPRRVGFPDRAVIAQVACGPWHTAAVSIGGAVFTWGDGYSGKLGHGDARSVAAPRAVAALEGKRITKVACGVWHTAAIVDTSTSYSSEGEGAVVSPLYTWGGSAKGALGMKVDAPQTSPMAVPGIFFDSNVLSKVACGLHSTLVLDSEGKVYFSGKVGPTASDAFEKVKGSIQKEKIILIAAGAEHCIAVSDFRNCFTWGRGTEGQLGHADNADCKWPKIVTKLQGKKILQVSCGETCTVAICRHTKEEAHSKFQENIDEAKASFGVNKLRRGQSFAERSAGAEPEAVAWDAKRPSGSNQIVEAPKKPNMLRSFSTIYKLIGGSKRRKSSVASRLLQDTITKAAEQNREVRSRSNTYKSASASGGSSPEKLDHSEAPRERSRSSSAFGARPGASADGPDMNQLAAKIAELEAQLAKEREKKLAKPPAEPAPADRPPEGEGAEDGAGADQMVSIAEKHLHIQSLEGPDSPQWSFFSTKKSDHEDRIAALSEANLQLQQQVQALRAQLEGATSAPRGEAPGHHRRSLSSERVVISAQGEEPPTRPFLKPEAPPAAPKPRSHPASPARPQPEQQRAEATPRKEASAEVVHEVERGVFITLQLRVDGTNDLKHVRFNRKIFQQEDAEKWWEQRKLGITLKYNIAAKRKSRRSKHRKQFSVDALQGAHLADRVAARP